ncbi:MAG TPA: protein kinase [Yinghuangia sp.]|nr:protein kinase [Yinghuangia sp.]
MEALRDGDPVVVGRYRIVGRLGSGGMGQVYRGRSPGGRAVAVKVVRPELAGERDFRRRFAREVEAARRVGGVFTAAVLDADAEGEPPWLATAFVPGMSLADVVRDHGPLPEASALGLGAGIAEALGAIHASGLVHRDLKPSNVLLSPDGPRVIDFGIALAADASVLTRTGMAVGSPGYMSPEQVRGEPVGPPSDVFSLGTVLAFAATGQGPFGDGPLPSLMFRIAYESPRLDHVPDGIRDLVEQCLHKEPAGRPSVDVLLDELAERLAGRPVEETVALHRRGWLPETLAYTTLAHGGVALGLLGTPDSNGLAGNDPGTPDQAQGAEARRANAEAARVVLKAVELLATVQRGKEASEEYAAARREEADKLYEEARRKAAEATADIAAAIEERKSVERQTAARQEEARQLVEAARRQADGIVADARSQAERVRAEVITRLQAGDPVARAVIEVAQVLAENMLAVARETETEAERLRTDAAAPSAGDRLSDFLNVVRRTVGSRRTVSDGHANGGAVSDGAFRSHWFAVPEQRPVHSPETGLEATMLNPGKWYLAVDKVHDGSGGDGLLVEVDGVRGVLWDIRDIQHG